MAGGVVPSDHGYVPGHCPGKGDPKGLGYFIPMTNPIAELEAWKDYLNRRGEGTFPLYSRAAKSVYLSPQFKSAAGREAQGWYA